jgi:hypothetical protein
MKKLVISTLLVMNVFFAFAQTATGVTGKVVDSKTQKPLQNVVASIQNTNSTQTTDAAGKFSISNVAVGKQLLQIKTQGYKDQLLQVEIVAGKMLDLGVVVLEEDITEEQQSSLITITDNDLGDDNSGSESTSGLLQASRDAFQQTAAFNWGQARFRVRGLDNEYGNTMINGVSMNKVYDGRPNWSNWGGLNDATRNQEFTSGSAPSDYTFGGILGTQEINTRASLYRKGSRISVAGTNTNYTGRLMGTTASGMRPDGWAYTVSASRRFAQEGYFEGTTYDANSFFASVERKITDSNSLNLTAIYANNKRAKNSPNTQEVTDLAGEKYNSYWGYSNGQKRNSRYKEIEEPIFMLSDYWKLSTKTNLILNAAYQFGKVGNSRLDYQGVNNPDPTYYRNLPSYFTSLYNTYYDQVTLTNPEVYQPGGLGGIPTPNYAAASNPDDALFLGQRQIDWTSMSEANRQSGKSKYVLYEDRTDDTQWTANAILNTQLADNISFNASGNFTKVKSHNFKNMLDLLGGTAYDDITLFGTGETRQSDLNNPNREVKVGDTFGYNYNLFTTKYNAFTQFKFVYKKVDFYVAQTFVHTDYQREGLYRNGYYKNNSFGDSDKTHFDNFGFKGGLTYKISGRQFINANGAYISQAPSLRSVFNNARVNNIINDISSEQIYSADISYIINAPKFKSRLTAFFSKIQNATETSFFFSEGTSEDITGGSDANDFVAETVTNLDKRNVGLELGMEYSLTSTIKLIASGNYGQYIYANDPTVSLSNDTEVEQNGVYGVSHLKNYKQSGTPQTAASFGAEYRDPHFWWVGANINYLGNSYIDIAPILRTDKFYQNTADVDGNPFPEATQARGDELLKQEKFDDFYLLNLTGGKSWKIKSNTFGFFASVNNVLDQSYKTGGYEQARNANYRTLNQDVSSGTPSFAPKYFYGYGRTYFLNLYLNF